MSTLRPFIDAYLRGREQRGEVNRRTAGTLRIPLARLDRQHGSRSLDRLTPARIDAFLDSINHLAPATRRHYLTAVRGLCRWMVEQGQLRTDPTSHVAPIRQPRRAPVTLGAPDVARLLAAAPDRRARAILWLMVGCGARCVEVARLQVADYDPTCRTVRLVGKAGHERIIPVPAETGAALDAYLDAVGRRGGPLIRQSLRSTAGLTPATISAYVGRWATAAGVKSCAFDGRSAHGLRRTAGSDVMDRSGSIVAVQEMLGHSSIETTARYYLRRVTMEQLRSAMAGRDYGAPEAA